MQSAPTPESQHRLRKLWLIIACVSLVALALLWSVDSSIRYILTGVTVYSLFNYFLAQWRSRSTMPEADRQPLQEPDLESYRPSGFWMMIEELKSTFKRSTSSQPGSQFSNPSRILVFAVAGFIGFIFFIIIMGVVLDSIFPSGGSSTGYAQRGYDFYNTQQYDSAAYYYRLAIGENPDNADLWFERGNALLNANSTDSALVMYERAIQLRPAFDQARYNIGYIYFNRRSYRESIEATKKIMDYNPEYIDAMLLIGDGYYNQSQLDSAVNWYEQAYERGYRSGILCHLMAYIYDVKGNTDQAIALYQEAIGQDSSIVDIYGRLGELKPGDDGAWYRNRYALLKSQQGN